jgi:hypothetical protein
VCDGSPSLDNPPERSSHSVTWLPARDLNPKSPDTHVSLQKRRQSRLFFRILIVDGSFNPHVGDSTLPDKTRKGLHLHPIVFISQRPTTKSELSWHSYVGEAACGRWAMQKFKKWLLGRPFAWLADCSGLKRFFDSDPGDISHSVLVHGTSDV